VSLSPEDIGDEGARMLGLALALQLPGLSPVYKNIITELATSALQYVAQKAWDGGKEVPRATEVIVVEHEGPRPAPKRKAAREQGR